ncbi:phosphoserine phosphatase SerB [Beijerinckia indica]|uniref:Phosphoserine phosphatase n=1 Tax=Beijerinckia indica subsp. indica (strain ATCC 9039 / DSM 1715 / NCIMB 8712) TaxID=395963 RepID=B2ICA3_BEII9|nr:phosphoserine phosphatase SerB [Beijerinckia indica]ACB96700.1 phosphoserine phosphatase SerB [Beijerinckia indica subsp. indica ATCC 9039]
MTHVATLVCDPAFPQLGEGEVQRAAALLPGSGAPNWLDTRIAADILFEAGDRNLREIADEIRAALSPAPIDVIVQPVAGRRKKLFLADMDSTMIRQECIDELADQVGKKKHVAEITERAMRGEISFEPALRERVALLKGLHPDTILRVISRKITMSPGARTLVQTLRQHGVHTVLVSGGFTAFTSVIGTQIGFHENFANVLLLGPDGRLAGEVQEPILGKDAKLATLVAQREKLQLSEIDTIAVGDGANDLDMIRAAGLGLAYHAKPAVAAAAHACINHADLTALLYAQGYRGEEFWRPPREQLNPADWKRKYGGMEKAHERRGW